MQSYDAAQQRILHMTVLGAFLTLVNHYIIEKYREFVMSMLCVSVCLSVREYISGTTRAIFTNFYACCLSYLWPWLGPPPTSLTRCALRIALVHAAVGRRLVASVGRVYSRLQRG